MGQCSYPRNTVSINYFHYFTIKSLIYLPKLANLQNFHYLCTIIIQNYLTMARTTLSHPFDSMSGKLASTDKIIMRTRNGRTHAYVVKHPYKGPLAPSRQKAVSSFAEAVKQTSVIMNTPELRSEWEEKYADYRKKADRYPNTHPNPYTTFRGFIIGSLIHASK